METPEELAPQVVAVIVTCDPGEWFEESLAAFGDQDYPELSVLVLDCGVEDVTDRVARALPAAYVRRLERNLGFGASADIVLEMVEGASHFLFCHDDVAPDPEAVGVLVEESFRSNAGIVSPKVVSWDDPRRLLHVGMAVDKGGAVVDRVEPGEIDHGQHDSVRDVFLAPGGCTLVRADLFAEIGGFDPQIFAMGEDLDLCWRAQIAGARVIVAPEAKVRHLQMLASGRRGLPEDVRHAVPRSADSAFAERERSELAPEAEGAASALSPEAASRRRRALHVRRTRTRTELVTLQSLQRRHELRAVLKNYGRFHRMRVVPQLLVLSVAEVLVAWVTGHRDRAAAVIHAWRWNMTERSTLRAARAAVKSTRRLDDGSVRRLQLHGSARLTAYLRRAVLYGMRAARLGRIEELDEAESAARHPATSALGLESGVTGAGVTGAIGAAVATAASQAGEAAATGPGSRSAALEGVEGFTAGSSAEAEWRRMTRATRSARIVVWLVVWLVLVFGTRQLIGSGFPYVGQLLPFPSWSAFLHHFFSGWQPTGVGTTSAASPADGFLGLGGLVLFGGVGLLQKVVVLGCIPLGAFGMSRLVMGFGSVRGRVASAVAYLVIPLPYDALATGHWDALLAYAACPWIVGILARTSGVSVADTQVRPSHVGSSRRGAHSVHASNGRRANGRTWRSARTPEAFAALPVLAQPERAAAEPWRRTVVGRALTLGVLEALLTSVAPSGAVLTLAITAALALGTLVVGGRGSRRAAGRMIAAGTGATAVAVVLLAPWSISVLSGSLRWQVLTGAQSPATTGPSWGSLLHLGIGPIGDTPLAWGLVAAAALPLLIAAGPRLAWAGRAWTLAGGAWLLAWAGGRGWLGAMSVPAEVMLVPAAVGIAVAIGLGVAAFEMDLPGYRFGWRQVAAGLAALVAAVGTLPLLAATTSGRWGTPSSGYGEATSWMARQSRGNFRVLWLGDPAVLPGGAWQLSPGLAYSLSENGLPDATSLWPGSSPGAASAVADVVKLAESSKTVRAGQLLAPYAVRYVVVVSTLGPSALGSGVVTRALPPRLLPGLSSQIDLRQVISETGFEVFVDDAALPERALLPVSEGGAGLSAVRAEPGRSGLPVASVASGWRAVLQGVPGATHVTGSVGAGTLFDAVAPWQAWQMAGRGSGVTKASEGFGFGSAFELGQPSTVTVRFAGSWRHGLAVGAETVLWVVVLVVLLGRRRWLDRWFGPSRPRYGAEHQHDRRSRANLADDSDPRVDERELVTGRASEATP